MLCVGSHKIALLDLAAAEQMSYEKKNVYMAMQHQKVEELEVILTLVILMDFTRTKGKKQS